MSKKPRIFAHFVRLITDVCLLKFGLRNKIEVYFYKPYLGQLNLWGSIVEINNKKFKMFALFELYQWYLNSMKISAAKHNFFSAEPVYTLCTPIIFWAYTRKSWSFTWTQFVPVWGREQDNFIKKNCIPYYTKQILKKKHQ